VSRSKRLEGVADAAPHFMGHLSVAGYRHRPSWSNRVLFLLVLDVLADHRFVTTYGRDEIPPGPEVLPHEIALAFPVHARQMRIALLPLMNPTTCDTAYFGGIDNIM